MKYAAVRHGTAVVADTKAGLVDQIAQLVLQGSNRVLVIKTDGRDIIYGISYGVYDPDDSNDLNDEEAMAHAVNYTLGKLHEFGWKLYREL